MKKFKKNANNAFIHADNLKCLAIY